ncbi:ABC transporter permease [Dactylosporangium fulvum]|uniref:ABC transporter permease n=1 Tax=Dactylosporangium fulvum TaxID=53359 RepID=A0ABY5WA42_9ACTN|nr:ABC transporter permease [Dactylosporangium fulvum]UWP86255.1 ABC transporter permease [Dactylosporangium fulvum]
MRLTRARRWISEVGLGARLALGGGREGLLRTGLTAVGVALGVTVLLLAASVPTILSGRTARDQARNDTYYGVVTPRSDRIVRSLSVEDSFRGHPVRGRFVQPEGAHPVLPPGVRSLPPAGSMLVSPAMKQLLDSPDGALLRERYPARIAGTIGQAGLIGPNELVFIAVRDNLSTDVLGVRRLDSYGTPPIGDRDPLSPLLLLLVVVIVVVLLMPVAMFVAAATRFGGEQRDRRLAAVRLVGADAAMTHRIAAGEAVVSASLGVLLGGGLFFLAGRALAERFEVAGISVFTTDVRPVPVLAALIVVAVPLAALAVTLLALRRVVVEPLGVVRRAAARTKRRLWWRIIVPVAGLGMLAPLSGADGAEFNPRRAVGGVVLLLLGVAVLLPWLFDRLVGRFGGAGGLSWQLAVRRLQLAGGSTVRAVNTIAVAAAGTIALQMLFAAAQAEYTRPTGADLSRAQAITFVTDSPVGPVRSPADIDAALRSARGVTGVSTYREEWGRLGEDDYQYRVLIGDCAALRDLADLPDCADGDAFLVGAPDLAGKVLTLGDSSDGPRWTVPVARPATTHSDSLSNRRGVLVTPSVAPPVPAHARYESLVRLDTGDPDVQERLRTAAMRVSPTMGVAILERQKTTSRFAGIRNGLYASAAVTLLLVGLSLLVSTLEQLRERRRTLAALVAFGARRGTIGWSILWQTAVPVALGLGLAAVLGVCLGAVLLRIVAVPIRLDWASIASVSGISAGVVLLVTVASMPALWRLMRPDGLRFE